MQYSQGLIDNAMSNSPEKEYQAISKGVDSSRGLVRSDDQFNSALSMKNPQSDAIRQKYMGEFDLKMGGLKNQMSLDAKNASFNKLAVATEAAAQEAQLNFQKEVMKYRQRKAKQAQRMAVVGNVLGLVGMGAGAMAGGPVGAGVGMQAGQTAGGMAAEGQ
jgi:hypothetical protein